MAIDLGARVYCRAADSEDPINGTRVHVALVTGASGETRVDLAVKPNQAPWFDAAGVELQNNQSPGAAYWSPWPIDA